jgi:DNA-binding MarR family transcriptional regulator
VGGVFSVIRTSLLEGDGAKLVELAPSLMGFIVAPYLGQAAARLELEGRPARRGHTTIPRDTVLARSPELTRAATIARTSELPIRVTHRTTLVLHAIERTPYANNREIARAAGIADEGQASKLLARLEQRGVIENVGVGPARGEPNAWLLTPSGRRAIDLISGRFASGAPRPRGSHAEDVA